MACVSPLTPVKNKEILHVTQRVVRCRKVVNVCFAIPLATLWQGMNRIAIVFIDTRPSVEQQFDEGNKPACGFIIPVLEAVVTTRKLPPGTIPNKVCRRP